MLVVIYVLVHVHCLDVEEMFYLCRCAQHMEMNWSKGYLACTTFIMCVLYMVPLSVCITKSQLGQLMI